MIIHYLKNAIRNLMKYKIQNLIGIIGLTIGILCFSICFYCNRYIGNMDEHFTNYNRLADITLYQSDKPFSGTPAQLIKNLQNISLTEIQTYCRITYARQRPYNVEVENEKLLPYEFRTIEVDSSYNTLFTPEIIHGSWIQASHTPNAVVLTESISKKIFGEKTNPVGKSMYLTRRLPTSPKTTPKEGGIIYTIQAVIKDIPLNTSFSFLQAIDILTINDTEGLLHTNMKDVTGCNTFSLLYPGKTIDEVNFSIRKKDFSVNLFEQKYSPIFSVIGKEFRKNSYIKILGAITLSIGLLILFSGLLNFFHFLIGSFYIRNKEYSIRKVIGGNSLHLFSMLFIQTFIILFISGILLLVLIEILSSHLHINIQSLSLSIDQIILTKQSGEYLFALILLCALICFIISFRIQHTTVLTGILGKSHSHKHYMQTTMLGIQFFICWIFFSLTVALYLQAEKTSSSIFNTLSSKEKESIYSFPLSYSFLNHEQKENIINKLKANPDIKEILIADVDYLSGISGTGMYKEPDNHNSYFETNVLAIDSNFFSFMNIPIIAGKNFESSDAMLVDKKFIEKYKSSIGTVYYNGSRTYTICGTVSQFITDVYNENIGLVFIPLDSHIGHCYIKSVPQKERDVKLWIEKIQKEFLPSSAQPPVITISKEIYEKQAFENKLKGLILFLSCVCLTITLLGVYSTITFDTEKRRKEVAIRKINGAGIKSIITLFMRLYTWLLGITALIAFPIIGLILQTWKQMYTTFFNYNIWFWVGIFLVISVITTFTIIIRILKIARINPAEVIKNE